MNMMNISLSQLSDINEKLGKIEDDKPKHGLAAMDDFMPGFRMFGRYRWILFIDYYILHY